LVLDTRALVAAKLGCTNLIFVEPGAKINGHVLPRHVADAEAATAICGIAGDVFVFQQDNAPAHRARDTVEFLRSKTPQFISVDLNPVNYCIWGMLQERVYRILMVKTGQFTTQCKDDNVICLKRQISFLLVD